VPYTEHDDENTNLHARFAARLEEFDRARHVVAPVLPGDSIDSPTDL
jgi:hypothetical protein